MDRKEVNTVTSTYHREITRSSKFLPIAILIYLARTHLASSDRGVQSRHTLRFKPGSVCEYSDPTLLGRRKALWLLWLMYTASHCLTTYKSYLLHSFKNALKFRIKNPPRDYTSQYRAKTEELLLSDFNKLNFKSWQQILKRSHANIK